MGRMKIVKEMVGKERPENLAPGGKSTKEKQKKHTRNNPKRWVKRNGVKNK